MYVDKHQRLTGGLASAQLDNEITITKYILWITL